MAGGGKSGKPPIPMGILKESNELIYDAILQGWTSNMIYNHLQTKQPEHSIYFSKKYVGNHVHKNRIKIKAEMERNHLTNLTDYLTKCEAIYEQALLSGNYKLALAAIKQQTELLQLTKTDTQKVDVNVKQEQNKEDDKGDKA